MRGVLIPLPDFLDAAIRACEVTPYPQTRYAGIVTVLDRLDRTDAYRQLLEDRPWKHCPCGICSIVGIEVAIFRGSERNKRRGFHNTFVFHQRLQRQLAAITP